MPRHAPQRRAWCVAVSGLPFAAGPGFYLLLHSAFLSLSSYLPFSQSVSRLAGRRKKRCRGCACTVNDGRSPNDDAAAAFALLDMAGVVDAGAEEHLRPSTPPLVCTPVPPPPPAPLFRPSLHEFNLFITAHSPSLDAGEIPPTQPVQLFVQLRHSRHQRVLWRGCSLFLRAHLVYADKRPACDDADAHALCRGSDADVLLENGRAQFTLRMAPPGSLSPNRQARRVYRFRIAPADHILRGFFPCLTTYSATFILVDRR